MAIPETSCKVNFVGTWYEDTFTDDVMKTIAAYSQADKGKKVKLTLTKDGVKLTRSKMFQQNSIEFYHYEKIKAVTKNPCYGSCILFILDGETKKYKIVAIRCPSDSNSIYIVNRVAHFRENARADNVEFKKRDNGNWTLRERSAHNANMHLREVFKEQQKQEGKTTIDQTDTVPRLNGNAFHIPVLDKSKNAQQQQTTTRNSTYIRKNGTLTRESVIVKSDEQTGEIHAIVNDNTAKDPNAVNDLMIHIRKADALQGGSSRRGSNLPSKPSVVTGMSSSQDGPIILRSRPKSAGGGQQVIIPQYDQWASHRRFSGDFIMPTNFNRQLSSGTSSVRSSGRVQFDSASIVSVPHKTFSMRVPPTHTAYRQPANFSTSSTIERSIENTYGRPVIIQQGMQRRASGSAVLVGSRHKRPSSIHVMRGNDLKVYQHGNDAVLL